MLKDLCIAAAAVTTAVVALRGLSSWRSELKGRAKFEAARDFIRATYRLRGAVEACRSPWILPSEYPEGYISNVDRTAEEKGLAEEHVYYNRLRQVFAYLQEFNAATLEAEVTFGSEAQIKASALRKCVGELKAAIDTKIQNAYSNNSVFKNDEKLKQEVEQTVQDIKQKTNQFTQKINTAIDDIDLYLNPYLSRY